MTQSLIRVILVDDHAMVRAGIRRFLAKADDIIVIAEAGSAAAAEAILTQHEVDVALVDINLPETDGIMLTRRLRDQYPAMGILIVTAFDDEPYLVAALRAGAHGYILKAADPLDVIRAVRRVARGESVIGPSLVPALVQIMVTPPAAETPSLTQREIEVLRLAADGDTNREIGQKLAISDRTVQTHLARIYRKFDVNTRTEAVKIGLAAGLIPTTGR